MRQLPLLPQPSTPNQREKHLQRKEKVLGQFFTPPALAEWMVKVAAALTPNRTSALDPACGDGAFLLPLQRCGFAEVVGIDIDPQVLTICAQRLGSSLTVRLQCADALTLVPAFEERFDLVATNPPFSAKYGRMANPHLLRLFALGRGRKSEALEVLFLELCVRVLRDGGVLAIVLPEGIFANLPLRRVREWIFANTTPVAVVSLSRRFFSARTCILFARKGKASPDSAVVLAHAEDEGDLEAIAEQILQGDGVRKTAAELLVTMLPLHHLRSPSESFAFPVRPLGELLQEMRCGATVYGPQRQFATTGIPFVSAKTVTPFGVDLRRDGRYVAKGSVMDKPQAYTKVGDVLFVRVGVGCIGRAAVVLTEDETGVADDYLYILRFRQEVMRPEFFALLTHTRFFRQQLDALKRGTGTVTIPQQALRHLQVPVPPLALQEPFVHAYRQLHQRYQDGEAVGSEWQNLVSKLERMLRGEKHGRAE